MVEIRDTNLGKGRSCPMQPAALPLAPHKKELNFLKEKLGAVLLAEPELEPEPEHLFLVLQLPPKATIVFHELLAQNQYHSLKKKKEYFYCWLQKFNQPPVNI